MLGRILLIAALAGSVDVALGQQGPPVPEAPSDEGGVARAPFSLNAAFDAYAEHAFASDLDDPDQGSVSVTRVGGVLDVVIPLREGHKLIPSFGSEYSRYNFDEDTLIAGTDQPWDDVLEHRVGLTYQGKVNEHWGVIAGGSLDASYQTGADFGDSLTYGARLGATYTRDEKLTIGLGVAAFTRLEDGVLIIPFPVINWKISEQWSVRTGSRGVRGLRGEVVYSPFERFSFSVGAGVEGREFRLDEDGPISGGVGRDWRVPVSFIAQWHVAKQVTLRGEVGAHFFQSYTIDDINGNEVADADAGMAPFVGVGVAFTF